MEALNERYGTAKSRTMKATYPANPAASRSRKTPERVISLTATETLSEKDFDQFEKIMKSNPPPKPAAKRAAQLHATFRSSSIRKP